METGMKKVCGQMQKSMMDNEMEKCGGARNGKV